MAKLPEKIGKYPIVSLIATGGMGAVYKGLHPTLNRHVILKKLTLRGNSAISERFKREARIMMDFRNDNIVDVYDHFKEGNSYYIVQEYVDGIALDALIKQQRYLPNDITLLIFLDACKALSYAHGKQVIHRDIKPANILLSKNGDIKLVDFGIATSNEDSEEGLTREGMTLGTPSYMAPEQFQNTKNVDNRADIYSMGVTLYEMVTGKRPFPGNFTAESIIMVQKGKYKSAKKINPRVAPFIHKLIKKMMQAKPRKRYQSLEQIINLVQRYIKVKNIPVIRERLVKVIKGQEVQYQVKIRKSFFTRLLAALFLIVVIGGGAFYYLYSQNYHYEWLWAGEYGAVLVAVRINKNLKPKGSDFVVNTWLFNDQADKIPDQTAREIVMAENKKRETKNFIYYESQKFYLKSGYYSLKAGVGSQLFWYSFNIDPRAVQKANAKTREMVIVEIPIDPVPLNPVVVNFTVRDQLTSREILEGLSVQFRNVARDKWADWGDDVKDLVLPGKTAYFKFEKEGYYTKVFDLSINAFQNRLDLNVILVPVPGELVIGSRLKDLVLKIDNSVYYRSGDTEGRTLRIGPTDGKERKLALQPGKYTVTAGSFQNYKPGSVEITVEQGKRIYLNIDYDAKVKALILNTK